MYGSSYSGLDIISKMNETEAIDEAHLLHLGVTIWIFYIIIVEVDKL